MLSNAGRSRVPALQKFVFLQIFVTTQKPMSGAMA
jgi:hypothetical protein